MLGYGWSQDGRWRSLLKALLSAAEANAWTQADRELARNYESELSRALETCLTELPELQKKLRKKKAG